jgi:hypothetical protein
MANVIDRHALILSSVTLNGAPARVTGIRDDYAVVRGLRGEGSAQFAWETVANVVLLNGGAFRS